MSGAAVKWGRDINPGQCPICGRRLPKVPELAFSRRAVLGGLNVAPFVYDEASHSCPMHTLTAIDAAHNRDPDSIALRAIPLPRRLWEGLETWEAIA